MAVVFGPMDQSPDEMVRKILDTRSLDALNSLKHINRDKGEALQRTLIQHFYSARRPLTHEEYIQIADRMEEQSAKPSVSFRRRGSFLELDDV